MTQPDVVVNAGPLIHLDILGKLDLLRRVFARVFIPDAVLQEVVLQGKGQPGAEATAAAIAGGWFAPASVHNRLAVEALPDQLHLGEAEVIVLAREQGVAVDLVHDLDLLINHGFRISRDLYDRLIDASR